MSVKLEHFVNTTHNTFERINLLIYFRIRKIFRCCEVELFFFFYFCSFSFVLVCFFAHSALVAAMCLAMEMFCQLCCSTTIAPNGTITLQPHRPTVERKENFFSCFFLLFFLFLFVSAQIISSLSLQDDDNDNDILVVVAIIFFVIHSSHYLISSQLRLCLCIVIRRGFRYYNVVIIILFVFHLLFSINRSILFFRFFCCAR